MNIGGIETIYYRLANQFIERGDHVLWIRIAGGSCSNEFERLFNHPSVFSIKIDFKKKKWWNIDFNFEKYNKVIVLSSNIMEYCYFDTIKVKMKLKKIDSFFWLPHYTGSSIYIEEFFPNPIRRIVRKYMKNLYKKMDENDNIIYFNQTHADAFLKNYKYLVNGDVSDKFFKGYVMKLSDFDKEQRRKKSEERNPFTIISMCRFEFPHKGYVLGLIKAIDNLISEFPFLQLNVIGYGDGEDDINRLLESCSKETRENVHLIGKVSPDNLEEYFRDAHLNIGVAGSIATGSKYGVISIPARSYSDTCEVYGFLPENKSKTLCLDCGEPVVDYIRHVINLSNDEFVELCKKSFDTYKSTDLQTIPQSELFVTTLRNKKRSFYMPAHYRLFILGSVKFVNKFKKIRNSILKNQTELGNQ